VREERRDGGGGVERGKEWIRVVGFRKLIFTLK